MGLVKSKQFAKRADYWERNGLNVIYSEKFYILKGNRKKRRLTQNKFNKIKADFIENIKNMKEVKEENTQSQFDDICQLETKLETIVGQYIDSYGDLIEQDIEQDPSTIKPVKHAKNKLK